MKILTVATKDEGYFLLLKQTAEKLGYSLIVLGWNSKWKGFGWKINLYSEELKNISEDEPVICVDGYDVVVIGHANEMLEKFKKMDKPIVFSGQRYFPTKKWIRKLADKLMSNNKKNVIGETDNIHDYCRPCLGLFVGYAGSLLKLMNELINIEKKINVNNDQVLLNIYYLQNPESIKLDYRCELFQNLWRTQIGLYGKISPKSKKSEIEIIKSNGEYRILNKEFKTLPCFMHGPFNLDMSLVLKELQLNPVELGFKKGLSYWNYSLMHHIKRGINFFWKGILIVILIIILIVFILIKMY